MTEEAYAKIMDSNVKNNLWLCNMVQPQMAARRDGSIMTHHQQTIAAGRVSSIGGLKGNAAIGIYGLSKAADMQLARNLAVEWGPDNIRVNCIAPGLVRAGRLRLGLQQFHLPRSTPRSASWRCPVPPSPARPCVP